MHRYPVEALIASAPGSRAAAKAILPILWEVRRFTSIVDVGCGSGTWLKTAEELGAADLVGFDACDLESSVLDVDSVLIRQVDFEKMLPVERRFDLCICLEVVEHLKPQRAASFVRELCSLADVILFSAAIPFQGGYGHVNEQWPQYWASHFRQFGFRPWDGIRYRIWMMSEIPWWYRQNTLVYVKTQFWDEFLPNQEGASIDVLPLVHPECFLWKKRGSNYFSVPSQPTGSSR